MDAPLPICFCRIAQHQSQASGRRLVLVVSEYAPEDAVREELEMAARVEKRGLIRPPCHRGSGDDLVE